jgi:serine protease AprX
MAGIIAGMDQQVESSMYNVNVFHGVAPRARIVSLKVATRTGETTVTAVLSALDWVVANRYSNGLNLRVLNLSFGTDSSQDYKVDPIAHAVEKAWHSGIAVVVSAGNHGTSLGQLDNPARDPFVIAVGSAQTHGTAATGDDSVSTFSSRGNGVRNPDLVAPGQSVQSLRVKASYLDATNPAGILDVRFFRGSGTSQAAAFVSGVAALMISRYGMAPNDLKATLKATANPIAGATAAAQGAGLVDVDEAVLQNPVQSPGQPFTRSTGTGSLDAAGDASVSGKAWAGKAWAGKAWAMLQE